VGPLSVRKSAKLLVFEMGNGEQIVGESSIVSRFQGEELFKGKVFHDSEGRESIRA
jgi:hypothetical protein